MARLHCTSFITCAHFREYARQRLALIDGGTQRVVGIDAIDRERRRLDVRSGERLDMVGPGFAAPQQAFAVDLDQDRGNFQQRVGAELNPPVSTSTTTGRKPRKRRAIAMAGEFGALFIRLPPLLSGASARLRRRAWYDHVVGECQLCGHGPALFPEFDLLRVTRQSVEIGAEFAGKALQALQVPGEFEGLSIQFDCRMRGEHAGAAAGILLGVARMRSAVGAEKVARVAAGRRGQQRLPVGFRLQDGQAIQVRPDAAG